MSEVSVKVTRKGQVTIPVAYRKRLHIREGTRLMVSREKDRIIMKPVPHIEDLAGIHSGKIALEDMRRELDEMRARDRY